MDNITVATPPDLYFAEQPEILFVVPDYMVEPICRTFERCDHNVTLYFAPVETDFQWIASLKKKVDHIVLDMHINKFYNGFFIDSPKTVYYNSPCDLSSLNTNKIGDALEFALMYIENRENES